MNRYTRAVANALVVLALVGSCPPGLAAQPAEHVGEPTSVEAREQTRDFEFAQVSKAYRAGLNGAAPDPAVEAVLMKAVEYWLRMDSDFAEVDNSIKALVEGGCKDPLVIAFQTSHVRMITKDDRSRLEASYGALESSAYPPQWLLWNALDLARHSGHYKNDAGAVDWARKAAAAAAKYLSDPANPEALQGTFAFRVFDSASRDMNILSVDAFFNTFHDLNVKDEWLNLYAQGVYEKHLGWRSRGEGMADSVSRNAWESFHKHLSTASESLEKAHALKPNRPEAALELLQISMASAPNKGKGARYWFDQATRARVDFLPAYMSYATSLLPKWGGTNEAVLDLGIEAASKKRFETDLPKVIAYVIQAVASETSDTRAIMSRDDVWTAFDESMAGMCAHPSHAFEKHDLAIQHVAGAIAAGQPDRAGEVARLMSVDSGIEPKIYSKWQVSPQTFAAAVRLFGGEHREKALAAWALESQQKLSEAANVYEAIVKDDKEPASRMSISRFAADRAALCKARLDFENSRNVRFSFHEWTEANGEKASIPLMLRGIYGRFGGRPDSRVTMPVAGFHLAYLDIPIGNRFDLNVVIEARVRDPIRQLPPLRPGIVLGVTGTGEFSQRIGMYFNFATRMIRLDNGYIDIDTIAFPDLKSPARVRVQSWDDEIIVSVNGKTVYSGSPEIRNSSGRSFDKGPYVGLVVYGADLKGDQGEVAFKDFRIIKPAAKPRTSPR